MNWKKISFVHRSNGERRLTQVNLVDPLGRNARWILASLLFVTSWAAAAAGPPPICDVQMCFFHQSDADKYECDHQCVFEPYVDVEDAVLQHLKSPDVENDIAYMYLDINGNVTVGIGHESASVSDAESLPFYIPDSAVPEGERLATQAEIKAAFDNVSSQTYGTQYAAGYYQQFSTLTLHEDDREKLAKKQIESFKDDLQAVFPDFDTYPAKVQEALFDMIYNLGKGGLQTKFPHFDTAIKARDWAKAGSESHRSGPSDSRNDYVKDMLAAATTEGAAGEKKIKMCPAGRP